jgi:phosphatidylglycerol lysyltransferase
VSDGEREKVLTLLRRHGWNATSFQTLEEGFRYWFDGSGACVAYVETAGAWVAAGAPLAPPRRLGRVARRFAEAARAAGHRAVFFATEARFSRGTRFLTQLIGEQPVWDPAAWPEIVDTNRSLRGQLRRAAHKGVAVRQVDAAALGAATALRAAVEALLARWSRARPLAPMGFLVDVQPFTFMDQRRYFVAERDGALVGFLAAVPIYARRGWLLEDLMRDPAAPNGTAELLIDTAMRALAAEGSRYVTLGLAPLARTTGWLGLARRYASLLYDFDGIQAFRRKLRPQRWDPIFISTAPGWLPETLATSLAIVDALRAFARGRLLRFGLATLLRGPAFVVRLLAVLLVPWTVLLALSDDRWFPSRAVKTGWVALDVALTVMLFALASRWRRRLGLATAAIVAADALTTAAQIVLYNLSRVRGPGDALVLAVALAAPSVATVILAKAVDHRRRGQPVARAGARPASSPIKSASTTPPV